MGAIDNHLITQRQNFIEQTVILQPGDFTVAIGEEVGPANRANNRI